MIVQFFWNWTYCPPTQTSKILVNNQVIQFRTYCSPTQPSKILVNLFTSKNSEGRPIPSIFNPERSGQPSKIPNPSTTSNKYTKSKVIPYVLVVVFNAVRSQSALFQPYHGIAKVRLSLMLWECGQSCKVFVIRCASLHEHCEGRVINLLLMFCLDN